MDHNNHIDFKDLWKRQSIKEPDMKDLMSRLNTFKKAGLRNVWMLNVLLVLTSVFIVCIGVYYNPQFISTKIGILLTILAMVMYLFVYNKLLLNYKNISTTQTNQEYLQELILIKKKQQFLQTKMIGYYFIVLTIGIGLYMYEYASRMSLLGLCLTYGLTLLWIGFNWFYLRPKQIKKQENKIDTLIAKFEEVNQQLQS